MTRLLALAVLLSTSPALAGDRPERVMLEPTPAAVGEPAFSPAEHPVAATLIVTGAVLTAVVIVAALVLTAPSRQQFPACPSGVVCG